MGMHLGIYYKTKDGKKSNYPIQAESHDELGGWLRYADTYIENHITKTNPEERLIVGLKLTEKEAKAIKPNYFQAVEYGTFDYYKGADLPEHFFAIYNEDDKNDKNIKYEVYENWTSISTLSDGLIKVMKVYERQILINSQLENKEQFIKLRLRELMNINMILGILKTIRITIDPENVALTEGY